MSSNNLSAEKYAMVVAFSEKCESQQSISLRLGVIQSTILRVQNRVRGTGDNTRRLGQGRKRIQT
jgi:transposase